MRKEKKGTWWNKEDDIFESFAMELDRFTKTQEIPQSGDQDVQYYLELQNTRLKKKGIRMGYDIVPKTDVKLSVDIPNKRKWSDGVYDNKIEWHHCNFTREFYRNDKKLYRKKEYKTFYQYITYAKQDSDIGEELYTCPNCGAVSKIKELEDGCPYCGTCYDMDDLFPRVTNYYMVPYLDQEESNARMKKTIMASIAFIFTMVLLIGLFSGEGLLITLVAAVLFGGFFGAISGWFINLCTMIAWIGGQAKDTTGMLFNSVGSKGRFVEKMKQYSPEFSFEYFSSKVISLLKMILFAEDVQELAQYKGSLGGELYPDIVDATFAGAIALKKFQVVGDYAELDIDAYVETMHDKKWCIKRKVEKYRMHLRRNINVPIDYHFSIKKIQCKNCAGSFDATKYKTCPNCGTKYDIGDDDWLVTSIEKR